jgi:hypothetical protein
MRWERKGLIFATDGRADWMASHASIPVVDSIGNGRLRVYLGTRDCQGRSRPMTIEVDEANPGNVLSVADAPLLDLGPPGAFDDNGMTPAWLVNDGHRKYLYYIGWTPQGTVPYRLAIGLAVSDDGTTFSKYSTGSV